jgi:glycosyltransferase involved in cell wall biosynthesis
MKLLILTQYYPPEIGAPQNRLHELAVRLKLNGIDVEVLTAMPNYPVMEIFEKYKNGNIKEEIIDGIPVHRAKIYVSKSKGILKRLVNYFSFVITSYFRGRKLENFDFLMVESPPLFLGYSAIALSKKLNAKLIFNVSDLWPESAEKMGVVTNKTLLSFAYNLEKRCYKNAFLITGQTNGIVTDILTRFPSENVSWLPNGVDLEYYNKENIEFAGFRKKNNFSNEDLLFFYGGIVGHAQGLKIILEAAKKVESFPNAQFIIQGAGPEKEMLMLLKTQLHLKNVHFLEPVSKLEMPGILKEIDIALVPLRKLDIFQGAIPSKVFEALSMEVPLLLGVDGEARVHFIDKADAGLFFEPENCDDLVEKIKYFLENRNEISRMGANGRVYVQEHFNRNKIAANFQGLLLNS